MKNENDYPFVLSPKEIAEILNCAVPTVYKYFNEGIIPSLPVGSMKRVQRDIFFDWLRNSHILPQERQFERTNRFVFKNNA